MAAIFAATVLLLLAPMGALSHDQVLRVRDMSLIPTTSLSDEMSGMDAVFIAEVHTHPYHHESQLKVIKVLHGAGVKLAIGLEMFRATQQDVLDRWVGGEIGYREFRRAYDKSWLYPWELYADILNYARDEGIALVGLNIDPEIPRKVKSEGFGALGAGELSGLPEGITCNVDERYRQYIRQAFGAHTTEGWDFERFCEAQLIWDKAMARNLADYLAKNKGVTVVVLSGLGHAWKPGIPSRLGELGYKYKVISPLMKITAQDSADDELYDYLIN